MKYTFFIVILTLKSLIASSQLLMVVSNDWNSTTAQLQRYERVNNTFVSVGKKIDVNLGRSGLGWSDSEVNLSKNKSEPQKREGDGRAPAGVFYITGSFGYFDTPNKKVPYLHSNSELICVDDVNSSAYNTITPRALAKEAKSFELMRRDDDLYELGLTLSHNNKRVPYYGSCVFLHVEKFKGAPTSGCTSMSKQNLQTLIKWLDISKKPLLIQVPKLYHLEAMKLFSDLHAL
ncbi:MAG: L,D-transpeptidase family protein [Campylobacterota bacterium]|nr:L,D-transpeptidase family protein [Campylobacterota bacterium]